MSRENINREGLILEWFGVEEFEYELAWVDEIKYLKNIIRFVPFLKQIGVCNSVAMGVANEESDIDLFIVSESRRVYLVRLWMVVVMQILGKRRYADKIKNRFCLSFFVDEDHINMSDLMIKNDVYFEFWVNNIWWLLDSDEFLNKWRLVNKMKFSQSLFNWKYFSKLDSKLWDFLNSVFGVIQRLKAHKTYKRKNFPKGVIFEEGVIKCHDQDIRWDFRRFIEAFEK